MWVGARSGHEGTAVQTFARACVCGVISECHEGRRPVVVSCITFIDPPSSLKQDPADVNGDVLVRLTRPSRTLEQTRVVSCLEDKSQQGRVADQSRFDPDTRDIAVNKRAIGHIFG